MVEIMKSDRNDRYEAPQPPSSNMHSHHHHLIHHHSMTPGHNLMGGSNNSNNHNVTSSSPFSPSGMGLNSTAGSLSRPMPSLPSNGNGMNGSPRQMAHHPATQLHPATQNHLHQNGTLHHNGNPNTSLMSSSTANSGVTVLNGGTSTQSMPYESESDNEKWWMVCCLEFCFCLL